MFGIYQVVKLYYTSIYSYNHRHIIPRSTTEQRPHPILAESSLLLEEEIDPSICAVSESYLLLNRLLPN